MGEEITAEVAVTPAKDETLAGVVSIATTAEGDAQTVFSLYIDNRYCHKTPHLERNFDNSYCHVVV